MSDIGRLLVFAGAGLLIVGGLLLLLDRVPGLPLGHLPGDFAWDRGNVKIYVPLATMIVVSILLTLVVNVILRFLR